MGMIAKNCVTLLMCISLLNACRAMEPSTNRHFDPSPPPGARPDIVIKVQRQTFVVVGPFSDDVEARFFFRSSYNFP